MSPKNGELLVHFAKAESLSINDLLVWYDVHEARTRVDDLLNLGYIEQVGIDWTNRVDSDSIKYRLSIKGRDCLDARQQESEQRSKKEAEKNANERRRSRKEWARFWLGLFLGWLLGAFTPVDLWGLITRLVEAIRLLMK